MVLIIQNILNINNSKKGKMGILYMSANSESLTLFHIVEITIIYKNLYTNNCWVRMVCMLIAFKNT